MPEVRDPVGRGRPGDCAHRSRIQRQLITSAQTNVVAPYLVEVASRVDVCDSKTAGRDGGLGDVGGDDFIFPAWILPLEDSRVVDVDEAEPARQGRGPRRLERKAGDGAAGGVMPPGFVRALDQQRVATG